MSRKKLQKCVGSLFYWTSKIRNLNAHKTRHFSIFSVKFLVHSFPLYRKMDPTALNMGTIYSIRVLSSTAHSEHWKLKRCSLPSPTTNPQRRESTAKISKKVMQCSQYVTLAIWSLCYCVLAIRKYLQFSTNAITTFCCLSRSERQLFTDLSGCLLLLVLLS